MAEGAPRNVLVVGFGMGPGQLTREAEAALRRADFVLAFRKNDHDPLLEVRRLICAEFGLPLVEVTDPERDREDPADYVRAVRDWHRARVAALLAALKAHAGTAAILVWGDPALYDSTLRLLEQAAEEHDLTWEVVAGISAPQLLAARHRIVLHPVGHPVHVTTARRLSEAVAQGQRNIVVMLGDDPNWPDMAEWRIWWGANLGTASERLVAGIVGDVEGEVRAARLQARAEAGWVMDAYLLRAPELS